MQIRALDFVNSTPVARKFGPLCVRRNEREESEPDDIRHVELQTFNHACDVIAISVVWGCDKYLRFLVLLAQSRSSAERHVLVAVRSECVLRVGKRIDVLLVLFWLSEHPEHG